MGGSSSSEESSDDVIDETTPIDMTPFRTTPIQTTSTFPFSTSTAFPDTVTSGDTGGSQATTDINAIGTTVVFVDTDNPSISELAVGVGVATVAVVAIVIAGVIFYIRRRKKSRRDKGKSNALYINSPDIVTANQARLDYVKETKNDYCQLNISPGANSGTSPSPGLVGSTIIDNDLYGQQDFTLLHSDAMDGAIYSLAGPS